MAQGLVMITTVQSVDAPNGKPQYWDAASAQLMRRDRIMRRLIPAFPEIWLESRGNPFVTLAR